MCECMHAGRQVYCHVVICHSVCSECRGARFQLAYQLCAFHISWRMFEWGVYGSERTATRTHVYVCVHTLRCEDGRCVIWCANVHGIQLATLIGLVASIRVCQRGVLCIEPWQLFKLWHACAARQNLIFFASWLLCGLVRTTAWRQCAASLVLRKQ